MKKILPILIFFISVSYPVFAAISGQINHDDVNYKNKIIDSRTKKPVSGAKISIPEIGFETYSDNDGAFKLNADVSDKTVMFVERDGYKVFSLTVDNSVFNSPLKLGIEQSSPFDMQITSGVIHLGDNMYSDNSANSSDFRLSANGHYLANIFKRPQATQKQDIVIRIGTLIGLDTKKAKLITSRISSNSHTTAFKFSMSLSFPPNKYSTS